MLRPMTLAGPAIVVALGACSGAGGDPTGPGVVVAEARLPAAGAVYRGAGPHLFQDGVARLTCGSHGGFSSAVEPPLTPGTAVVSDYLATFVGELALEPPLVAAAATFPLAVQAHMVERITLAQLSGSTRIFDTELVTFELGGSAMPAGAMVRESPDRESAGRTTITPLAGGQHRIESYYDVWLEISFDEGRTWHRAQQAIRMTLGPVSSGTNLVLGGGFRPGLVE